MNQVQFTIGCDPEIFVKKNGKPHSAYGLVAGTKDQPLKTPRGAVQVDGMALEFNTDPVSKDDFTGFNRNIVHTMGCLKEYVKGFSFNIAPVQEFSSEHLNEQPVEALALGCDPDFNAYTMEENPKPDGDVLFRTGAGHIHVGWGADIPVDNKDHFEICAGFVKALDCTVGMYMTYIDREPRRRELYGKAGAFRPKSYGVEYRTPSNLWIKNKNRRELMYTMINKAINNHINGRDATEVTGYEQDFIRNVINTGSWQMAKDICEQFFVRGIRWPYHNTLWDKVKEEMNGNS